MNAPPAPTIGSPLLIPFDGSPNAEAVLPYVSLLANGAGERNVVLLQVIPEAEPVKSPLGDVMLSAESVHQASEAAAHQDLARAAAQLTAMAPDLYIEQVIETGDAAEQIAFVATRCQARTIVLSSQGASAATPGGFGSVIGHVVRTAPVPVMIVKPGNETGDDKIVGRLVVAHDGSERAARVVPMIQDLAKRLEAHIHIVAVVEDEESTLPVHAAAIDPHLREEAQADALNAARRRVEAAGAGLMREGLSASWQILSGPAAAAIIEACAPNDVLAITSHGQSASRWMLGSVAEKVVRECAVPVILLRTPPEMPGQPS